MEPIADAIRALTRVFRQHKVTVTDPRRDSSVYKTGSGDISGTGTLAVWTPTGKSWVMKGFMVTAVVWDTLAAANATLLYFFDDDDTDRLVAPIGAFSGTAANGTTVSRDAFDLGSGRRASAAGSNLKIGLDEDIGGGNITVGWCVWGDEV